MKILHLLQSNRFSGAENVVCQIVNMMKSNSDIQMIYCSPDGPIRDALKERNIKFVPLKEFSISAIKEVIKEEKPDMIHAHDMKASFYASLTCRKIPFISHVHNNAFDARGFSPKSIAYCYSALKAKHIFWVSKSSFEGYVFHKFFAKKSTVLYNIIDIDALYNKMHLDENEYTYDITYLGRLTFPKNPQRLMNVLRLVREKIPNVRIAVIGSGDLENETMMIAKEYHLDDNVDFLGYQTNPLKMLYNSKVMVMTSRWEGTPMCALESLALGVPIVSTPVDGLKDIIEQEKNGYLSDNDEELAEFLAKIVSNEMLHKEMSEFSYETSQKYNNKDVYVESLLKVIKG